MIIRLFTISIQSYVYEMAKSFMNLIEIDVVNDCDYIISFPPF